MLNDLNDDLLAVMILSKLLWSEHSQEILPAQISYNECMHKLDL